MNNDIVENQNVEITLLLEAIYLKYGYDFRQYAWASIKRRIMHCFALSGLQSISELQYKIIYDQASFEALLVELTVNVTEMFRDPSFYLEVRKTVVPHLAPYPFIKIWHAGCATGEEAYSMAILLQEEKIFEKAQLYATDIDETVLQKAKEGIFPMGSIKEYTRNYQKSGGVESFSNYYTASYDSVILDKSLKSRIVFANHNLVTDEVFGEMQMIVCRNVLIYFNRELRERVIRLFFDSLVRGGFLCLGSKESIMFSDFADDFEEVSRKEKIYRKKMRSRGSDEIA